MVHRPDVEELASRIRIRTTAGAAQMMMQHQRLRGRRVSRSFNNADDVTTQQQRPTAHTAAVDYRKMSARNKRGSQAVQDVFSNANSNSGQFGTPK
ncbi:hypothetical protein B9Z55_006123 [Caenorhabditis nigoni]|uniref:Uncharacterized protein n=1 Tax=Caenorhabditis nigoni TaxID=1611254 RepID=A0A2G5V3R0_9PELO|nr:hypothetical protein B9Z55_006123 [Caenorhabditis nigoni]